MGSNRKQPFGYTMEFGHIVIHQEEAEWVIKMFLKYNQGASFKELAESESCCNSSGSSASGMQAGPLQASAQPSAKM